MYEKIEKRSRDFPNIKKYKKHARKLDKPAKIFSYAGIYSIRL